MGSGHKLCQDIKEYNFSFWQHASAVATPTVHSNASQVLYVCALDMRSASGKQSQLVVASWYVSLLNKLTVPYNAHDEKENPPE